mmetsp:Transcript_101693/g.286707  ORF Transcript_101693/g.286707 Transcript_101693/m.286707 type:complete len:88 (+) Transcript_101693:265-528(+)
MAATAPKAHAACAAEDALSPPRNSAAFSRAGADDVGVVTKAGAKLRAHNATTEQTAMMSKGEDRRGAISCYQCWEHPMLEAWSGSSN